MPEYHVTWEIDLAADSPREAAREALAIQRDPGSIATVFDVTDAAGRTDRVDLEESEQATKKNPEKTGLRRRVSAALNLWRAELRHRNLRAHASLRRKDLAALGLTLIAELSAPDARHTGRTGIREERR